MKMTWLLLCMFSLAGCNYTINYDPGGEIGQRIAVIEELEIQEQEVKIRGHCYSACTMHLVNACVYESAKLGFHGASNLDGSRNLYGTMILSTYYPDPLFDWFWENAALLYGDEMAYLTGAEVIELGAKKCE